MSKILHPRITADDWGFSPGVNEGILELAQKGIVRNVAATVNMPFFKHGWNDLLKVDGVEISLHLNFCFGVPLCRGSSLENPRTGTFYSLSRFALNYLLGKIQDKDLQEETRAQLQYLETELPYPLKTINGHQHCHLVPGVMKAILPVLAEFRIQRVRMPWDHQLWKSPKAPIMILSAIAKRIKLPHGIEWEKARYPLEKDFRSAHSLQRKIDATKGFEVLVHPAKEEDFDKYNVPDPYKQGRRLEYTRLKELQVLEK